MLHMHRAQLLHASPCLLLQTAPLIPLAPPPHPPLIRILTPRRLLRRRPTRATQRKIQHIARRPGIHKLPQTPADLHRGGALLAAQRVQLPPPDEDELVLAVLAVVHAV